MDARDQIARDLRRSRALTVAGVGLIAAWWITWAFGLELPWWGNATVLSVGSIALLHAINLRRDAGSTDPDKRDLR